MISRPRAPRIILESRSDGNYELAATCWSVIQCARVSSLLAFLKVNLDSQRCRVCFGWTWSTTSDYKSNQAGMTHSRHKGSSWISWRAYANVNGDYVDVSCQPEYSCAGAELREVPHLCAESSSAAHSSRRRKSSAPLRRDHPEDGERNLFISYHSSAKKTPKQTKNSFIRQSEEARTVIRGTVLWAPRCFHFTAQQPQTNLTKCVNKYSSRREAAPGGQEGAMTPVCVFTNRLTVERPPKPLTPPPYFSSFTDLFMKSSGS